MSTERKKLIILEVNPSPYKRKDGTEGKILKVKGQDDHGVVFEYCTFNEKFIEVLKVGTVLDCETETKQNGEYFNHYINQIYVDGQPVAGGKKNQFRDTSDNTRAECITQLRVAGVIDSESPLYKKLYAWLDQLGGKSIAVASKPAAVSPATGQTKPNGLPVFETVGKLLTYYTKEKTMTTGQICQKLGIKATSEIKDLTDAVRKLEGK